MTDPTRGPGPGPGPDPWHSGAPTAVNTEGDGEPTPEGYDVGGLLGRGGMGQVHVAHDRRLGRQVALKTTRVQDAASAERLAREARLTARLEHPNIVPVYAAGRDEHGAAWYTMRVLPGRSLADALADAPGPPARLKLVRHVLGAADALAYAHGRGVLHRDLKPASIMVGQFGETVVADWGIACLVTEQAEDRGGGTPRYVSPEQARGDVLDERSDVYALGAILFEVLSGEPPQPGADPRAPGAPPELVAIARRALQARREDRYPTAKAFAADLLAWFEGRRVGAHVYGRRELAKRMWSAWKVPIVVGSVSLGALVLTIAVGWYRTAAQRERAELSESRAVAAQQAERSAFAAALVPGSLTAAEAEHRMDAEILAANALVREETPEARGVLARFGGRPRMAMLARSPLPPPRATALSGSGRLLAYSDADSVTLVDGGDPSRVIAEAPGDFVGVAFAGDERHLVLTGPHTLWTWAPPEAPRLLPGKLAEDALFSESGLPGRIALTSHSSSILVDTAAGSAVTWRSCGPVGDSSATLAANGDVYVTCTDGRIVRGPAGQPGAPWVRLSERDDPRLLRFPPNGQPGAFVGTSRGTVIALDAQGVEVRRWSLGAEGVCSLAISADKVAFTTVDGLLGAWTRDTGQSLGLLSGGPTLVAWRPDGALRIAGRTIEDRSVPSATLPHLLEVNAGVAAFTLSPDQSTIAIAEGDGTVELRRLANGEQVASWRWQDGVAKDVAFSPDGRFLATAMAKGADQRVYDLRDGSYTSPFPLSLRRVSWFKGGWLLAQPYLPGLLGWSGRETKALDPAQFQTMELDATGTLGVGITSDDGVWRVTDGDPPAVRRIATIPDNRAAVPMGEDTLVLVPGWVLRLGPAGTEVSRTPVEGQISTVTTSPDLRWFAVGMLDGDVLVWRVGYDAPVARLRGHRARVAAMQFTADTRWLLTSAWDNSLRVWSLADLEVPGETLKQQIEAEWGRSLDGVLAGTR